MTAYSVSRHESARRSTRLLLQQHALPEPIDPLRSATQQATVGATFTESHVSLKDSHATDPADPPARRAGDPHQPAVSVMVVSQEITPLFLGFTQIPTPHVVLFVTEPMRERAATLKALLARHLGKGLTVREQALTDGDYAQMREQADALFDQLLQQRRERIVLHLTGGTKLMALAFSDAARHAQREHDGIDLLYVDTGKGRVERLGAGQPLALPGVLGVADAVLASGKPDCGCASSSPVFQQQMQRDEVHQWLLDAPPQLIGALNQFADEMLALHDPAKAAKSGRKRHPAAWFDLQQTQPKSCIYALRLQEAAPQWGNDSSDIATRQRQLVTNALQGALGPLLTRAGVLAGAPQVVSGALRLRLKTPVEIDYLRGGWLEALAAAIIARAQPDDWASGVAVGDQQGRNNELDAIITCGNHTLLVEIKTAALSRQTASETGEATTQAQNAIFKLDSVSHGLARYFNANWLLSARSLSDVDRQRAQDRRVRLFAPPNDNTSPRIAVEGFESALRAWIAEHRAHSPKPAALQFAPLAVSRDWARREQQARDCAGNTSTASRPRRSGDLGGKVTR